jgi:hypothetical protein
MSKVGLKIGAVLTAASLFVLVAAAVAVAAVSVSLGSPNGRNVRRGHIKVVVTVRGSSGGQVYVILAGRKRLNAGHLNATCSVSMACDTIKLHAWGGHPGKWIYSGPWFVFQGSWSSSPGKRFFQAQYFCPGAACQRWSQIGSFRVT